MYVLMKVLVSSVGLCIWTDCGMVYLGWRRFPLCNLHLDRSGCYMVHLTTLKHLEVRIYHVLYTC